MRVLSLFEYTGNMLLPWAEAGHECIAIDIQHTEVSERDGITFAGIDIRDLTIESRFDVVFAFPPCTDLALSGARWWASKGQGALDDALDLVAHARRLIRESGTDVWMIENPVGRLSTQWRKPDHYFNPCEYGDYLDPPGDRYTKRTCLWTGDGFVMPPRKPVQATEGSKMHLIPPGPNRANLRSATPMGFARAVFEANSFVTNALRSAA